MASLVHIINEVDDTKEGVQKYEKGPYNQLQISKFSKKM